MRLITSAIIGAVLASTSAQAAPRVGPEAQLQKALAGRVAGERVDCISLRGVRSSRIIDRTAIVYDAGGTIYVNRPTSGRESLDSWDTLVTKTHSDRLCSIDTVTLYDSGLRMESGVVFLGDFIPYRIAKSGQ
jgi:hypothetical protein